ncbi:MAG: carboxypeptidase regulatory-like domain-containing protein, partial [Candidatus Andersenbacteria bacterium]|nr:carboxypeptidase regulatory-like domain-containing protein [Candidatus Andersenbacteria bacterium]
GTSNGIDTDVNDTVTVTSTWDTASTLNAGGPLKGDVSGVQLRVTPRDDKATGVAVISSKFKVDRLAPQGLTDVNITSITTTEAILTWVPPKDSTSFTFALRYGTNADDVLDGGGELWDFNDDPDMNDLEGTTTTVKGLTANKTYTFKLFVTDTYGNTATSSAVAGITDGESPAFSATPTPIVPGGATPTSEPPTKPTPPPTTFENKAPTADAGLDQAVNPSALVILDGTASKDLDGDVLVYTWRQLSGASVDLLSSRTATPSFSAGKENETYIFALTVRDPKGASSTDIVTVATKQLPRGSAVPVAAGPVEAAPVEVDTTPPLVRVLRIVDLFFFALAVFFTMVSLLDRITRSAQQRGASVGGDSQPAARGRVVHYRTGEAIAGVQVLVYSLDGKLKSSERTNNRGEFSTLFPAGQYTIVIQATGFAFAPAAGGGMMKPDGGVLYTGGTLTVQDGSRPLTITIPLKPMGQEISTGRTRLLHFWQSLQKSSRTLSWPVFLLGAILNTVLIFWLPTLLYLAVELSYVVLVIVKVALEVRVRPAYGMVRDAITHVPLDLAVVRLYEQGTNRMIMTRVTNSQGKFFALPPASTYTVTVTKPGYAVFSKQHVTIAPDQDSVLQITTDLMPVTPQSGLAMARAAVL